MICRSSSKHGLLVLIHGIGGRTLACLTFCAELIGPHHLHAGGTHLHNHMGLGIHIELGLLLRKTQIILWLHTAGGNDAT
jgi:hypothetical protein